MKRLAQRYSLPITFLWVAWAVFMPVLFLPAFGSDGRWLAVAPQQLSLGETLASFRWAEPLLLGPLMRTFTRLFDEQAVLIWRTAALSLHLIIAGVLAALPHKANRQSVLALALATPISYRWLTALPNLFNQLAVLGLLLAIQAWRKGRREGALAFGLLGCLLLSTHTTQTKALFNSAMLYSLSLVMACGVGIALKRPKTHTPIRWLGTILISALCGLTLPFNAVWLRAYTQATTTWQALMRSASAHSLVLNAPTTLAPIIGNSWLYSDDELIIPTDVSAQRALTQQTISDTLTFGVLSDGHVVSASHLLGMSLGFDGQTRLNSADVVAQLRQYDAVFVGIGRPDGSFEATRPVGGFGSANIDPPSQPYLARFESGDNRVLLVELEMCAPNGVKLILHIDHGGGPNAKLFRHALRGTTQLTGNDTDLIGGFLDLATLKPGDTIQDISYFGEAAGDADAVRVGIYDWQTGQRWLALHADGAQWAENAVTVSRPTSMHICR